MPDTRLRSIHHNMWTRCTNPNSNIYKWYGAKGVSVCEEWKKFRDFEKWALEHGYADDLTLDRIDNSGGYCPGNCRWVTHKKNCNNRSSNRYMTYNGETKTMTEWSETTGIPFATLEQRILSGWDAERAFTEPTHDTHTPVILTYNGETKRLSEWAKELGIKYKVLHNRLLRGWSTERVLSTPTTS